MYRHSPQRNGAYRASPSRRPSPHRRNYSAFSEDDMEHTHNHHGHFQHVHHQPPHVHAHNQQGYTPAPAPRQEQRGESFHLLVKRTDIATQVIRELAKQLNAGTGRSMSPPPSVQNVVKLSGDKVRVDPNARHCPLCDTPYNIQIARQHFEGKRHRMHLIRLVHLREYEQLEQQALLARQAGLTLTEELYGHFAHTPLSAGPPSSSYAGSHSKVEALSIPQALRHQLEHNCDSDVGGALMQELLALLDKCGASSSSHGHSPSRSSYVGDNHPVSSGGYHNRGSSTPQQEFRQPTGRPQGDERSYFSSAGEQLRHSPNRHVVRY